MARRGVISGCSGVGKSTLRGGLPRDSVPGRADYLLRRLAEERPVSAR